MAKGRSAAECSNAVRYALLRRFGGVYVDTDVECLRSIEPLLRGISAFAGYEPGGLIGNAVIGASPNHPLLERAVTGISGRMGDLAMCQGDATGTGFFTRLVEEFSDVAVFSSDTFYPWGKFDSPDAGQVSNQTYAVHHWTRSWDPKQVLRLQSRLRKVEASLDREEQRRRKAEKRVERLRARVAAMERSRLHRLRMLLSRAGSEAAYLVRGRDRGPRTGLGTRPAGGAPRRLGAVAAGLRPGHHRPGRGRAHRWAAVLPRPSRTRL